MILLLPPKDVQNPDENINKVQLKANTLIDRILLLEAALRQPGIVQNLLHIVQGNAAKHGEPTVHGDSLRRHQGSRAEGQDHGREAGEQHNGQPGEERATKVEIFILLGGCTNERYRADYADRVQARAGDDSRIVEEERGEDGSVREVEGGPEEVLLDVAGPVNMERKGKGGGKGRGGDYSSGSVYIVANIVPIVATRPPPRKSHGFKLMSL